MFLILVVPIISPLLPGHLYFDKRDHYISILSVPGRKWLHSILLLFLLPYNAD